MPISKFMTPRSAAIWGLTLSLPGILMYVLLTNNVEPPFISFLIPAVPDGQPNIAGSLIAIALLLLLPLIAFIINFVQIRRTVERGGSIFAHPVNVVLAALSLALIA